MAMVWLFTADLVALILLGSLLGLLQCQPHGETHQSVVTIIALLLRFF